MTSRVVSLDDVVARKGLGAIIGRVHDSRPEESRELTSDFKVKAQVLGTGGTASVRLAKDRVGRKVALKSLSFADFQGGEISFLQNEVNIHLTLDHPHILRLEHVYETSNELHLVTEHMAGGDLHTRLTRRGAFSEFEAARCIEQTLRGVSYLHAQRVIHRDLKLENLMFKDTEYKHLKIIDFGLATRWDGQHHLTHICGTPKYVAPESWERRCTDKADIWAVGIIAYELLTGVSPYGTITGGRQEKARQEQKMYRKGDIKYGRHFRLLPSLAQDFLRAILTVDPTHRPDAARALQHPWLRFHSHRKEPEITVLRNLSEFAHVSTCKRLCMSMIAGELANKEIMALQEQFHAIDADANGSIGMGEFCNAMEYIGLDARSAQSMFCHLVCNSQSAEISYSEFLAAGLRGLRDSTVNHKEACKAVFQRFDEAGHGVITVSDRRRSSMSTTASSVSAALVQEADSNGDGIVSYKEFESYIGLKKVRIVNHPSCWSWITLLKALFLH
jgi:calcium-dependent protein kinase